MQHALRSGSLQARIGADQHGQAARRCGRPGHGPDGQVRRLAVPVQVPQARGPRADVHHPQAAEGEPIVPRGGPEAHVPPPRPGSQHENAADVRTAQRGEELVHEQDHEGQRRRAALRVHDEESLRGTHGLQVPSVAGHRHAGDTRSLPRGAKHDRDAGHHGVGSPDLLGPVLHGHQRAVRLHHRAAVLALPLHPASLREQAARRGDQQDRRPAVGDARRRAQDDDREACRGERAEHVDAQDEQRHRGGGVGREEPRVRKAVGLEGRQPSQLEQGRLGHEPSPGGVPPGARRRDEGGLHPRERQTGARGRKGENEEVEGGVRPHRERFRLGGRGRRPPHRVG
mmetsp:Transcript_19940/g.46846  ORF Transcript_19940/g.46846 Transcript_19940/m.46846 type:complete len:342 (-) Transcript_19940:2249-3274(-)